MGGDTIIHQAQFSWKHLSIIWMSFLSLKWHIRCTAITRKNRIIPIKELSTSRTHQISTSTSHFQHSRFKASFFFFFPFFVCFSFSFSPCLPIYLFWMKICNLNLCQHYQWDTLKGSNMLSKHVFPWNFHKGLRFFFFFFFLRRKINK